MNESEFEQLLRSLQPTPPSPSLENAIATQLAAPEPDRCPACAGIVPRQPGNQWWHQLFSGLLWACGGAAAAVTILSYTTPTDSPGGSHIAQRPARQESRTAFQPVESARDVVDAQEGKIIDRANNAPAKLVRVSSVERHAWSNPANGTRVEVEVPREDVVLLPVAFQ